MKIVFKAQIILSLLATSAFSIIGLEPSRAKGHYQVKHKRGDCKLIKIHKGRLEVEKISEGKIINRPSSTKEGKAWIDRSKKC